MEALFAFNHMIYLTFLMLKRILSNNLKIPFKALISRNCILSCLKHSLAIKGIFISSTYSGGFVVMIERLSWCVHISSRNTLAAS
ncbi:hypothetical protein SAMN02745176_00394 [Lutispora thermophila DSM 19022]|uniref:Uncharacterized protein n=1 Tax=Lutispora thermophila DSM 19022 TaxID=1122184 RepID=A0A1M6BCN7_9FIRM|nr:hypothetical protein SAMN02745176_00394 [Lutispora thermophila DSM 19022]